MAMSQITYPGPGHPFPFPEDLPCGEPYINWPSGKDLVLGAVIETEVAIPESWVGVGEDGKTNRTREALSLVMPRVRTIECEETRFVPLYRNKIFETSNDQSFQYDKPYLEYIGSPALHTRSKNKCDVTYHLLSLMWEGTVLDSYKLARYEGNDWLFQLYSGDTEKRFSMPTREALTESDVLKVCDGRGSHRKYNKGQWPAWTCDFPAFEGPRQAPCAKPEPKPKPEPEPVVEAPGKSSSVNLGLAVGLPVGLVGMAVLAVVGWYYVSRMKRRLRGDSGFRL